VGLNRKNRAAVDQTTVSRLRRPHKARPAYHLPPTTCRPPSPRRPISAAVKRFVRQLTKLARAMFTGRHARDRRGPDSTEGARPTCPAVSLRSLSKHGTHKSPRSPPRESLC
jgi:hypothetical protein